MLSLEAGNKFRKLLNTRVINNHWSQINEDTGKPSYLPSVPARDNLKA